MQRAADLRNKFDFKIRKTDHSPIRLDCLIGNPGKYGSLYGFDAKRLSYGCGRMTIFPTMSHSGWNWFVIKPYRTSVRLYFSFKSESFKNISGAGIRTTTRSVLGAFAPELRWKTNYKILRLKQACSESKGK